MSTFPLADRLRAMPTGNLKARLQLERSNLNYAETLASRERYVNAIDAIVAELKRREEELLR